MGPPYRSDVSAWAQSRVVVISKSWTLRWACFRRSPCRYDRRAAAATAAAAVQDSRNKADQKVTSGIQVADTEGRFREGRKNARHGGLESHKGPASAFRRSARGAKHCPLFFIGVERGGSAGGKRGAAKRPCGLSSSSAESQLFSSLRWALGVSITFCIDACRDRVQRRAEISMHRNCAGHVSYRR